MKKEVLRQQIKACLAGLDKEEIRAEDAKIAQKIIASDVWQKAQCIFCYVSVKEEIDTYPLLDDALAKGKRLAVPYIIEAGKMQARQIEDISQLRPDRYGIPAPPINAPIIPPKELDLIILPGIAYEKTNLIRLGRGGGYYDRFLARSHAFRLAPARSCQLAEEGQIISHDHDLPVDMIITTNKVWKNSKKK